MQKAPPPAPTVQQDQRASGILLHPTSLPGPYGCGDLGPCAHAFTEWLGAAKQKLWQMLPIGPIGFGNSPYSALSAFAGNLLLVSLEVLEEEGALEREAPPRFSTVRVDYSTTRRYRERRLWEAFKRWNRDQWERASYDEFVEKERHWLEGYALYAALKEAHLGRPWIDWPAPLRNREPLAIDAAEAKHKESIAFTMWGQWLFHRQWHRLREHCNNEGIALIGDIPIFVAHDSADVWLNRSAFDLDEEGLPRSVAGVPPDYFSATGQRWGNPLYLWDAMEADGYTFWVERFRHGLQLFDYIRLDHFIGFVRYWEIPAHETTAQNGSWRPGPGIGLFEKAKQDLRLDRFPFIAEDLGAVTPSVTELRDRLGLPGTKILQFAFGNDPQSPSFRPYNYPRHAVVYSGTHDNDTTVGWFRDKGGPTSTRTPEEIRQEQEFALRYLGGRPRTIHWDMIRGASGSVANWAIFPMQDVLGLGTHARMNHPGTLKGNWEWRMRSLPMDAAERLALVTETFGRS